MKKINKPHTFILFLSLLLIVGYMLICSVSTYLKTEQVRAETEAIKVQIEEEQREKEKMENVLNENNIDKYLEERAREEFGYIMPDEKVFYVVE